MYSGTDWPGQVTSLFALKYVCLQLMMLCYKLLLQIARE